MVNIHFENISKNAYGNWAWVVIFAIAFAWVESAVVVYLREIYFDGGFSFPLIVKWENGKHVIDPLVRIELGREIATITMLAAVGWIAGKNRFQRFCFFMIAFGIWDIFYYIWLYVMVGWPESIMTWDLLFYVPLPWVGPVITPLLIAFAMAAAGTLIIYYDTKGYDVRWRWYDMAVELSCGLVMIVAFCWDWRNILQLPGDSERTGIPNPFAWWLYLPALLFAIVWFVVKLRKILIDGPSGGAR
ncbi:MAG: hypothetical protein B6I22_12625 [Desulfobacteraceae bacterium 4572_123]|nr:MAG: hypothetical protein B6I22_12625 [Desulfobacteraceae bacterium 4572_123]